MGARAAVFDLLTTDSVLQDRWDIDRNWVFPAQSLDTPPANHHFLVMRWEDVPPAANLASTTEILTIWAHSTKTWNADYAELVGILRRVKAVFAETYHASGADGVMTCATYQGMSPDLDDNVQETITKNIQFQILSR